MEDNTFNLKQTIKRIVDELEYKIKAKIRPNPNEKKRLDREGFFMKYMATFPMSKNTYYKYKAFVNDNASFNGLRGMSLDTFYKVCTYTNVSADYLLGFIDTKRKEQSAEMVRKEFGLSDESMAVLKKMKDRELRNEWYEPSITLENFTGADFINFILTDYVRELAYYIDFYFSAIKYHRNSKSSRVRYDEFGNAKIDEIGIDEAKYRISQSMEKFLERIEHELLDDIQKR